MINERPKEFADRDLINESLFPTITWSSMYAFISYDREKWYRNYVLGQRDEPNNAMKIGIEVGERIVSDPTFIPTLERPEIFEHNLKGKLGDINIRGHLDGSYPNLPGIDEFKTSSNINRWDQKAVDEWGQITFYCLLYYLNFKIPPESLRLRLWSIPIAENGDFSYTVGIPTVYTTKRTMLDILKFSKLIMDTHKEMSEFIHSRELTRLTQGV